MNAVSGTILIVLLLVVCFGSRRWALLAMMAGVFFLTQGVSVDLAGLNIYAIRFLEAAAFARVLLRRELVWSQLNRIDRTLLLLYNYVAVVWILRSADFAPQEFASALDPTFCYLGLRGLMRDLKDVRWLLYAMVGLLIPYTALVFVERLTVHSAFTMIGALPTLEVRNGVPRCEGSFRHAILLGSAAASFVPLYIGLSLTRKWRTIAVVGGGLCLALVLLSNSGGPLTAGCAALVGWSFWPMRKKMPTVRYSIVALLLLCIIFMKAPIWYLPFKVSQISGGGGYHRGLLMEMAWQDLHKWWLFGMDIRETVGWFPYVHVFAADVGGADVTNQFIVFGIKAGLAGVALAIALLTLTFKGIGGALAAVRSRGGKEAGANEFLLWGLGVTMLVHTVSWFGISYFDQSWVVWLMHVAAASTAVQVLRAGQARATEQIPTDLGDGGETGPEAQDAQLASFCRIGDLILDRETRPAPSASAI